MDICVEFEILKGYDKLKKNIVQSDDKKIIYINGKNVNIVEKINYRENKTVVIDFEYIIDFDKYLKKNKIKFTMDAGTDLNIILEHGGIEVLQLLKYYIDKSIYGYSDDILESACVYNNPIIINFLLEKTEYACIWYAFLENMFDMPIEIMKLFLEKITVDNYDKYGDKISYTNLSNYNEREILDKIIEKNEIKVLKLINEYDIFDSIFYDEINELMTYALYYNFIEMAEYLVEQGAELEYIDSNDVVGYCKVGSSEAVEWVFDNRKINQKFIDEIFIKMEKCRPEFVQLIIDYGANDKKYGKTLRKNAIKIKNKNLVKYLDGIDK